VWCRKEALKAFSISRSSRVRAWTLTVKTGDYEAGSPLNLPGITPALYQANDQAVCVLTVVYVVVHILKCGYGIVVVCFTLIKVLQAYGG
jgi:hypothetical protein